MGDTREKEKVDSGLKTTTKRNVHSRVAQANMTFVQRVHPAIFLHGGCDRKQVSYLGPSRVAVTNITFVIVDLLYTHSFQFSVKSHNISTYFPLCLHPSIILKCV